MYAATPSVVRASWIIHAVLSMLGDCGAYSVMKIGLPPAFLAALATLVIDVAYESGAGSLPAMPPLYK